jgi:phosphatidate cytidylyltransferase
MSNLLKRLISSLILIPIVIFLIIQGSYLLLLFTLLCFFISCYEWYYLTKNQLYKIHGYLLIFFSFYSFYKLSSDTSLVFFVILICISTDVGGYFFGNLFKGPKLTKISPNKTYAGMFGSYILSILSFIIIIYYVDNSFSSKQYILLVILISTISQIGDLIISYFKRLAKVKDTGKILPGHGGLLDRIDGMIFTFPLVYIVDLNNIFNL